MNCCVANAASRVSSTSIPSSSGGRSASCCGSRRDYGARPSLSLMTIRVVQWTTGNVGKQSVIAITRRSDLELIGCYAWSREKVGRDVGELCGLDWLGLTATDDVDGLLALRPDCVVYNPMWPSIEELVRILVAGVNVVTTAAFINGWR